MKYFVCEHCGNIVEMVNDSGVPVVSLSLSSGIIQMRLLQKIRPE